MRRGCDSNSRGLSAFRFSRPAQLTALPPLRRQKCAPVILPSGPPRARAAVITLFPVGAIPAEKFLEPLDIAPVKIDKILPFAAGHLARIRRRTGFDVV